MREEVKKNDNSAYYFYVTSICIMILTIMLVAKFIYLPATVSGVSMDATLKNGDLLAYSLLTKKVKGVERGDIVAVKTSIRGEKMNMVKRVIALPGENIKILNGSVFINNGLVTEGYLPLGMETEGYIDIDLREDEYFVMGDNRPQSMDSRERGLGPILEKDILGVVVNKDLKGRNKILETIPEELEMELPEGFFREFK